MRACVSLTAITLGLTGCQYTAEPPISGPVPVYTSEQDQISGKYLLFVDGTRLQKSIRSSDVTCIAHTFPVDLRTAFPNAISATLKGQFEQLEVVSAPIAPGDLAAKGAIGMIQVTGLNLDARLSAIPGFLRNTMDTTVTVTAAFSVDGKSNGRLLGMTVEGDGQAQADGGMACEGGSKALATSSSAAIEEVTRRIAEAIAASDKVRANK